MSEGLAMATFEEEDGKNLSGFCFARGFSLEAEARLKDVRLVWVGLVSGFFTRIRALVTDYTLISRR